MTPAPLTYLTLPLFEHRHGKTYDPVHDGPRLTKLYDRVFAAMSDHQWWTLRQLVERCGGSEGGCGARFRDMKKLGHETETKRTPSGLWFYRLVR